MEELCPLEYCKNYKMELNLWNILQWQVNVKSVLILILAGKVKKIYIKFTSEVQ